MFFCQTSDGKSNLVFAELWIPPYVCLFTLACARCLSHMPAALSKDMRWRVVKKSYMDEQSVAEIVSDWMSAVPL